MPKTKEEAQEAKVKCPACGAEVEDADNCKLCNGTGKVVFP